jgi:flavin reductase (DIM6/NTAB) family NADH-FMN oxidoreductase RutF
MAIEAERFRQILGQWASGVTVVTSRKGDRVHGMTVSAFSSVSLEPPLVLISADKCSNTHELIREAGVFAVSILAQGQEALSDRFASKKEEPRRFDGLDCRLGATGCPHLPAAAATLDCRVFRSVDAGDHVIYLGEVIDSSMTEQPPLLYYRGRYRSIEG